MRLTGVSSPAGQSTLGYLYNTTNTCIGSANINQPTTRFLANAYVDLGTYYGFTPYVGGGAGFNINTMSGSLNFNETANGQPYAADLTPTGTYPQLWINQFGRLINPQPNIAFAQQNWNRSISSTTYSFAWALSAGIGYQLTPSTTLDVGYRYLNSGAINNLINPQTGMTVIARQMVATNPRRPPLLHTIGDRRQSLRGRRQGGGRVYAPLVGRRPRDDPEFCGSGKNNYVALAKALSDSGA